MRICLLATALAGLSGGADPALIGTTAREFDAVLLPAHRVQISTAAIGLLRTVEVERGDRVRAGQVLAVLDSGVERAELEVMRARAESDIAVGIAEIEYALKSARLEQRQSLFEDGLLSVDDLAQYRSERDLAQLELEKVREDKVLAALELERAQAQLDRRTVRSPFDGVVVERHMSPGELVSRNQDDVILELAQLDPLIVEVRVPQSMLAFLRKGMKAVVRPEAPFAHDIECEVTVVDPVVDAASGSLRVRLALPNPDHSIPAGLRCRARFLD